MKACIVTCGGLCPGLNTVIREIVCGLWYQYGVREILGIDVGHFSLTLFSWTFGALSKNSRSAICKQRYVWSIASCM